MQTSDFPLGLMTNSTKKERERKTTASFDLKEKTAMRNKALNGKLQGRIAAQITCNVL